MQSNYLYTFSAEQLREAAKTAETNSPVTFIPLTQLYTDQHAEKVRKVWTGTEKLNVDSNRSVKINGKHERVSRDEQDKNNPTVYSFKKFNSMIEKELKIDPQQINTSYSQDLMNLTMFPLSYNQEIGTSGTSKKGTVYTPVGMEANMYRENENVFFKVRVDSYAVVHAGATEEGAAHARVGEKDKEMLNIKGPIEIIYKLEDSPTGSKFALQSMSTNSDFLCAAFLGQRGLEAQLERAGKTQQTLREIEDTLITPPPQSKPMIAEVINKAYFDALTAVGQYQKGQISANQLVEVLEGQKRLVEATEKSGQGFVRRHSMLGHKKTATYGLEKAIDSAKKLAFSEATPAPINRNITSLRRDSVNSSDASKKPGPTDVSTPKLHMRGG